MAKGVPATDKQKAAASKNSQKANAARAARKALRKEEKPRWKKLEDGDITVADLTMDELIDGTVTNNDGTREGRRHMFSQKWLNKMNHERVKRIRAGIDRLAPAALEALEEILGDDEARAQQLAASKMIIEYNIGKVPEVVHVGVETEWERMAQQAYVIQRGVEAVAVEDDQDDQPAMPAVVRGEVLSSEEEQ